jgi:hypothetical protein
MYVCVYRCVFPVGSGEGSKVGRKRRKRRRKKKKNRRKRLAFVPTGRIT